MLIEIINKLTIHKLKPFNKITLFNWIVAFGIVFLLICIRTQNGGQVTVNCFERGLRSIPNLNYSVTYLDLCHNEIAHIPRSPLPNKLNYLDMS